MLTTGYSHVIDEIFLDKIYDILLLRGKIAIDIGASIGDSAIHFALEGAYVFAYEPDNERFGIAVENVKQNSLDGVITLYNKSVSSAEEINHICLLNKDKEVFLKMDCEGCSVPGSHGKTRS